MAARQAGYARMAQEQPESDPKDVKLPLKLRLKAWWDGDELVVRRKQAEAAGTAGAPGTEGPEAEEEGEKPPLWTPERIALAQEVWGAGCCGPTEAEAIIRLIKPAGLNPAMRMLDLGAGLGGATRIVAKHFGAWATGLEADPDLAAAGAEISRQSDLSKKAVIEPFDPGALEPAEQPYNCVFSKEFLFCVEDKRSMLEAIKSLVKEPGHLVFTDYVLPAPGKTSPALEAWIEAEPVRPHPWAAEDYVAALQELEFDVRVAEDFTATVKGQITAAWSAYMTAMEAANPCGAAPPALAFEVGLWMRRAELLESGDLQVCRFHAMRKEDPLLEGGDPET